MSIFLFKNNQPQNTQFSSDNLEIFYKIIEKLRELLYGIDVS